jgi:hypothetical protein
VSNRDIGFVHAGQEAEIKIDTFNFTRYGLLHGQRTARSLMAEAGVSENVAERVLGHALPGVRGVYNRYDYADEKADALQRLAAKIEPAQRQQRGDVYPLRSGVSHSYE